MLVDEAVHDPSSAAPRDAPGPTWLPGDAAPAFAPADLADLLAEPRVPLSVVVDPETGARGAGIRGELSLDAGGWPVLASLPPSFPEWLGDRTFGEVHGTRFPYVVGAMANGIATVQMVEAAAEAGFLAFFGAAGLSLERVEAALNQLAALDAKGRNWGSNLIHSPNEPALEAAVVDLYLRRGVRRVSASAFMGLTAPLVRYAASGLRATPDGRIERSHHVFAKISRPETAARFMAPPPAEILAALVGRGELTEDEARLAARLPLAEDITVESDSGGHTDNQALGALFPTIARLRDQLEREHGYASPIRVGAAGGLGTPSAVASAFALGAAYVLTGSVNQSCIESGLAEDGRRLLAAAELSDVTMAPAADMFEMGVDVQVLKRGTMFAPRGHHLRALYRTYPSLEAIPAADRARIEKTCFRKSLEEAWAETRSYWARRDPAEVERSEREPKHKMALTFRAYLGQAS
ncbi:MAG: PfaD family polyunsaturated fatty acid/polyketide biosynthesis protein, partial [Myxococcota bacterium]